jgi:hypothetical protein
MWYNVTMKENRLIFREVPGLGPNGSSENVVLDSYLVQRGDSIWGLTSSYYGLDEDTDKKTCETIILYFNPDLDPTEMKVGITRIKLPSLEFVEKRLVLMKRLEETRDARDDGAEQNANSLTTVPGITPEKLAEAQDSLTKAKRYIVRNVSFRGDPVTMSDLNRLDEYYIPLMIKESRLNNEAVSPKAAVGYFGITASAAADVEQDFAFEGRLTKKADKIYGSPINNCVYGMLNLWLSRNKYAEQSRYSEVSPEDKDKLALMMHNKGPTKIGALWDKLGANSYRDFQNKLSDALARQMGVPTRESRMVADRSYSVNYEETPAIRKYIELHNAKNWSQLSKPFLIDGEQVEGLVVGQVGEVLRYSRIITAMSDGEFSNEGDRVGPPVPEPTPTPEPAPRPVGENVWKTEALRSDYSIWSMSNDLMKRATDAGLDGFQDLDHHNRDEVRHLLQVMIIDFNILYNSELNNYELGTIDVSDLPSGLVFMIPNLSYTANYLEIKFEESDLEDEGRDETDVIAGGDLERLRGLLPSYVNDPSGSLEREGNRNIVNSSGYVLPTSPSSKRNRENREKTSYIVLHSTISKNSGHTIRKNKAHYVVEKDGTIKYIVNSDDKLDTAGRITNNEFRASWNGDGQIGMHSIGIEVVAQDMKEWTPEQYAGVKKLVEALGEKYELQQKDVLAHWQVACNSSNERGRKSDPYGLDYSRLGLPNNFRLVDYDVVSSRVAPNLSWITTGGDKDRFSSASLVGLRGSVELAKDPEIAALARDIARVEAESFRRALAEKYQMKVHTVKKGDTLTGLARRYGTTVSLINKANGIDSSVTLSLGQQLYVPVRKR